MQVVFSALTLLVGQQEEHPALSISPNSDKFGKQSLYGDGDLDRHENLIICSLLSCSLPCKFCVNLFGNFCAKWLTKRWMDKQTNNGDYISSLAELTATTSGNDIDYINKVTIRQARLALRWVAVIPSWYVISH